MRAFLSRFYQDDEVTLGTFAIEGKKRPLFYTLENPWRDNKQRISCIPNGVYKVSPFSGVKYKNVYQVENVPGRDAILLHWGNTVKNTEGCILLGLGALNDSVTQSVAAINKLISILDYQPFELHIMGGEG